MRWTAVGEKDPRADIQPHIAHAKMESCGSAAELPPKSSTRKLVRGMLWPQAHHRRLTAVMTVAGLRCCVSGCQRVALPDTAYPLPGLLNKAILAM